MADEDPIETFPAGDRDCREALIMAPHTDPEFPDIPYPIIRPVVGSPYYIDPRFGKPAALSKPGTPPLTSEDIRRELEDFP